MKKLKIMAITLVLATLVTGCYESPIDREQYKEEVYLVGAANQVYMPDVRFNKDTVQQTFIAVAVGGSRFISKDAQVSIALASNSALSVYNNKYVAIGGVRYQLLPTGTYAIPSMDTVIKAGNVYTRIPVKINTSTLNCDSLYALPIKIKSSDLPINAKDSVLLLSLNLTNWYSGSYQLSASVTNLSNNVETTLSTTRTLKAVNQYVVRFFNKNVAETSANLAGNGITLTVNPTDNSVSIASWGTLVILNASGTYDPVKKAFYIRYRYVESSVTYQVVATLSK